MNSIPLTTIADSCTSPAHLSKQPFTLPKASEDLEEANQLLSAVTPAVFQSITVEEKNALLCTGVYDILAARFGCHPSSRSRNLVQSKLKQHDRALKEVTHQKNETRQVLRKAKRDRASDTVIQSLAANFLSLLRQHSDLKRVSIRRLQHKEAKLVRAECHRNFWKFAKGLLDGGTTPQVISFLSQHSSLLL